MSEEGDTGMAAGAGGRGGVNLGRFRPLALFVGALWVVHLLNVLLDGALTRLFGLVPRTISGLDGIIGMPFLHGSWEHLSGNTAPLLILGGLIVLLAPRRFWSATVICVLLGGLLTWLFARGHNHIGASGLVFGWFGFLVTLGFVERSAQALFGAGLAIFIYGASTLLGLAPTDSSVSWDGHLFGLVSGVAAAWTLGRPKSGAGGRGRRFAPAWRRR